MQVRKVVAVAAVTLCVCGAAADIAISMLPTASSPLAGVVGVLRTGGTSAQVADVALPADALPAGALGPDRTAQDRTAQDQTLSATATGSSVGLVAGILVGGLVGVIFGAATGVLLMLFAGIGVAAIPLVSIVFGADALGDGVAGGLVGAAVGGLIGLLGVSAPDAAATVIAYLRARRRRTVAAGAEHRP